MYRPLPDSLTIKNSPINGLGLFAVEDIEAGTLLGVVRVPDVRFENGYIRTPLGGFINHSNEPNCVIYDVDGFPSLVTLRGIKAGEELTVSYTLYQIG